MSNVEQTTPAPGETKSDEKLFIVGIGASAGGLSALKKFFAHVPPDSGLAYVVVVHLSPEHKSYLPDLLQTQVGIPVEQVTRTVKLEPNHVYVIPPNANLDTIDTHLRLSELEERRQERAPIDHFFRTLARTHDGQAVGVVLTGTGSDGTQGVRDIKEADGVCLAQDPADAEYDSMPQSAIATGMIDLVLPVTEIPAAILRIVRTRPRVAALSEGGELEDDAKRLLQQLFTLLRAGTGRDYRRYKRSTITRRIERRMQLRHVEDLSAYTELLRTDSQEVRVLSDDLLITVTSFFRDPEVFEKLERDVIPSLFSGKGADDEVRIWSVGCATGEEAYSLAILLFERAYRQEEAPRIQVFASDMHEGSLQKAREGYYPGDIETDVTPERLERFFVRENGGYRVRKELREAVVFAPHNVLADPPFSRLDLISCRNLLIYIQRGVQVELFALFHYALRTDGFLVLGTSETAEASDLFRAEGKKLGIYRRRNVSGPEPRLPVFPLTRAGLAGPADGQLPPNEPAGYKTIHRQMIERYAAPSALVNGDDKLVHLSEHAGRYLVTPGGEPTVSILKLVRRELQFELRTALRAVRQNRRPIDSHPVLVQFNSEAGLVTLRVRPSLGAGLEELVLVIFDERPETELPSRPVGSSADAGAMDEGRVQELKAELSQTQQQLQTVIQEHETSQEEMTASNEEMQSTNEELRSTMEELETSKEELQSLNEELQTVNQENRHRVDELAQLSDDLQNLLLATDIATLFLDRELRILRFTPRVGDLFNVRPADRGRPISDLTHRLVNPALKEDADRVLERLVPVEREVKHETGRWYLTRILPYRSADDQILGVVITFIDVTERKRAEQELAAEKIYAESIVETMHEPLVVLTPDLTVKSCNAAFYSQFHVEPEETHGIKVFDLGNSQWDIPELRRLLEDVLPDSHEFNDYEVEHEFEGLGRRVMLLNARRLDHVQLILLGIRDITESRKAEIALRDSEARYRRLFESIDEGFCVIEVLADTPGRPVDFRFLEVNPAFEKHTGFTNATGRTAREFAPDLEEEWFAFYGEVARLRQARRFAWPARTLNRHFDVYAFPVDEPHQMRVAVLLRDITEQVHSRQTLREADQRKDEFLATLAHELRGPLAPIRTGLEVLKASREDPAVVDRVCEVLERQTLQLVALVNDLLDISRITRGTVELRKRRTTLSQVVQSAVEAAQPFSDDAHHELSVTIPAETIALEADPHRLAQVLFNLLSNAIKYTPPGGNIWLTAVREQRDVVFAIRDTGSGIPREMHERVFDIFTQLEQDRADAGLGIGLTLVKSLVELHHGRIRLESAGPKQGTTFTVRLPVVVEPPDDHPAGDQTERPNAGADTTPNTTPDITPNAVHTAVHTGAGTDGDELAGLRVLVVDDNTSAADMLGMALEHMACTIQVAYSGEAAINAVAESPPHVVLMDIGMPRVDGYEAARRIRQAPGGTEITLIALTGWGQEEHKRRTRDAGFDHHLIKPPHLGELRTLLAEAKSRHR